ncbi:MAG: restriction endonuclease [Thermorudis peleae]|nr:restriction endonuclease [Thermorudis peleae]
MARRVIYEASVSNAVLGKTKVVRGETPGEVRMKIAAIQAKWAQEEARLKARQQIENLRALAEEMNEEAAARIESYRSLLKATLFVDDRLNWEAMYDRSAFLKTPPNEEEVRAELNVPPESRFIETLWPRRREQRIQLERKAKAIYEERLRQYEEEKRAFEERQAAHNAEVDTFRQSFEAGAPDAVERYIRLVLGRSQYPEELPREFEVQYRPSEKMLVVDYRLPSPVDVPRTVACRYSPSKKKIEEVEMNQKEFRNFYDSIIYQITLRTIHEIFESDYPNYIEVVVFNGWVQTVDPATGHDVIRYIISVRADREQFSRIDLARVDPKATVRALKGLVAGALFDLSPVRPIIEMTREDPRFIEAREILEGLESGANLLDMPWDDFEHLVRELFDRIFTRDGAEVHVTRASRDYGVDAIVFDPDPLRGGKFVVQAKRYSGLVPTAAVRELYGTMMNERASRGLLVTTGYFGKDAYEFARDKPITLIDGSNLVYLFHEHGYHVRIGTTG